MIDLETLSRLWEQVKYYGQSTTVESISLCTTFIATDHCEVSHSLSRDIYFSNFRYNEPHYPTKAFRKTENAFS